MSTLLYNKFEMPESIKLEEVPGDARKARFIAEPFERGFGHTIGNSLRRLMLTSIEAPAIISFFMEGVHHEYMALEGVLEDMTNIILNLKGALLRKLPFSDIPQSKEPKIISTVVDVTEADLAISGQKLITLKDIFGSSDFDLVNPDLVLFTVTKPMTRRVDIRVAYGRGYVPSERHLIEDKVANEIIVDSAFTPVRLVNYFVEATRVGQDTDFDRLIIEVETDGRITPKEALSFASKILMRHLDVFEKIEEYHLSFEEQQSTCDTDLDEIMQKLVLGINEIELSVRSTNCLSGASIETIGELVVMPEPKLLQFRNFGKKSLNEIKAKLTEMNLSLGMDLTRYGINQDNIKQMIADYNEAHPRGGITQ